MTTTETQPAPAKFNGGDVVALMTQRDRHLIVAARGFNKLTGWSNQWAYFLLKPRPRDGGPASPGFWMPESTLQAATVRVPLHQVIELQRVLDEGRSHDELVTAAMDLLTIWS